MNAKNRLYLLDSMRGLSVISMVIYHAMYDIVAIYGVDVGWYFDTPGYIWQQSICWSFILISGICWGMGKAPLKRGIAVSLCGLVITAATFFFMPSQLIVMGVLSFIGAAMLLMIPVSKFAKNSKVWFAASAALFFITRNINSGWLGFEKILIARLPSILYALPLGFVVGLPAPGFYSSDYFSLIPWFFLFASGHFGWQLVKNKASKSRLMQTDIPLLGVIGRKSLIIYMLHQPLTMAVLEVVSKLLTF